MRWQYAILLFMIMLSVACHSRNRSTDTRSTIFSTEKEKVAFLEQYVTCFSPVDATEFHILYHDNSTGWVPGPSDWDFKIAARIAPIDSAKWIVDFREVQGEQMDLTWIAELALESDHWTRMSTPQYYQRPGTAGELIVYKQEGILFKRIRSQ